MGHINFPFICNNFLFLAPGCSMIWLSIASFSASASQHAANNERESALQSANAAAALGQDNHSAAAAPPNYEELDPPPAYSVLFPNQKAISCNTLNSLEVPQSQQLQNLQLPPSAAPSSRSATRPANDRASGSNPTATPITPNPTHGSYWMCSSSQVHGLYYNITFISILKLD